MCACMRLAGTLGCCHADAASCTTEQPCCTSLSMPALDMAGRAAIIQPCSVQATLPGSGSSRPVPVPPAGPLARAAAVAPPRAPAPVPPAAGEVWGGGVRAGAWRFVQLPVPPIHASRKNTQPRPPTWAGPCSCCDSAGCRAAPGCGSCCAAAPACPCPCCGCGCGWHAACCSPAPCCPAACCVGSPAAPAPLSAAWPPMALVQGRQVPRLHAPPGAQAADAAQPPAAPPAAALPPCQRGRTPGGAPPSPARCPARG